VGRTLLSAAVAFDLFSPILGGAAVHRRDHGRVHAPPQLTQDKPGRWSLAGLIAPDAPSAPRIAAS